MDQKLDKSTKCMQRWYPLTPHPVQVALVTDRVRYKVVPAGRRCLEAGTMVATPNGPVAIEDLSVGAQVIGFDGVVPEVCCVLAVYDNGVQEVYPMLSGGRKLLAATAGHRLWARTSYTKEYDETEIAELTSKHGVCSEFGGGDLKLTRGAPYKAQTYDITVGNETNLYCLHRGGVVTHNSGKSERAKRFIVREALTTTGAYFVAAPTRDQVKRIYWEDLKLLSFCDVLGHRSHAEVDLRINFPNGSTITLVGLDQPQRIEGISWAGGLVDEIADTKPDAWPLHIAPALDTYDPSNPGRRPWAWLLGVPEGRNHYYDIAEYARTSGDPDWKLYTWHSSEILPPDVIAAAMNRMSDQQFRQEYQATFETATGLIYAQYGSANFTTRTIEPHEQLHWMHDFNYTPMSSCIGVRDKQGKELHILDEIILTSAVARQTAEEFVLRYAKHQNRTLVLYGDPAGRAGEKHGHASDYTEIEAVLKSAGWKVTRRVKLAAPAIVDRHNAVRAKIRSASGETTLFVNIHKCRYVHKGFSTVVFKEGSSYIEEHQTEFQHVTTAVGYCVDYEWPVSNKALVEVTPLPTVNHYNTQRRY